MEGSEQQIPGVAEESQRGSIWLFSIIEMEELELEYTREGRQRRWVIRNKNNALYTKFIMILYLESS
jgi:hypothetical protein